MNGKEQRRRFSGYDASDLASLRQERRTINALLISHELSGRRLTAAAAGDSAYNLLMPAVTRPHPVNRLRAALYFWRGRFHRHFGNLSGDRREYQMAVDDFSKAIDLHPIYVSALYSRGVLYWRELENYYRAVKDLTRVIELAPHWHEAWFNRALAHQLRNEIPAAIADYEHYLTLPGKPKWRISAQTQLEMIKAVEDEKAARVR